MTLLAAFATLLYRYTGQEDLLVGTVTGGRKRPEIEKLMGFFLNTVVLRPKLAGNPTFRQLLGRVRQVTLGAYAHDDVPFEHLVMELRAEQDLSRNPLFQVMLALNPSLPALEARWTVTEMDVDTGAAKFDLVI